MTVRRRRAHVTSLSIGLAFALVALLASGGAAVAGDRPTRTPIDHIKNPRPAEKTPRATRTPIDLGERTRKPTAPPTATRTPLVLQERTRKPTERPTATRTPLALQERTRKPSEVLRPTRTPLELEERTAKPTKTLRPTRTAKVLEERTTKPTPPLRPTRTPLALEERTAKPTKTLRPTRTPVVKEHAERTEIPLRPTRTLIPTKTATPVPQFNAANVTASCSAIFKNSVSVVLRVTNNSGGEIFNVSAGALAVEGSAFKVGPAPSNFTRLPSGQTAIFRWRGEPESDDGACAFSVTASARGPNGETVNIPSTDCGSIVFGHGAESDLLGPCGSGAGEGGAEGCGDSGPGPTPVPGGGMPDLTVDGGALASSVMIETRNFPAGDCAIVEGCVGGTGARRLLRFSTVTPNIGSADVFLGDPRAGGNFVYSGCHAHYHFNGYANYRLYGSGGERRGHKQAFCLIDLDPIRQGTDGPKYTCLNQGITAGWADVYDRYLDCQWVDITGLAPGTYTLEVSINPGHAIPESNYSNNTVRTTVNIPPQ